MEHHARARELALDQLRPRLEPRVRVQVRELARGREPARDRVDHALDRRDGALERAG